MNDKPNDIGTVRHFESGADVARKSAEHAGAVLRQAIADRGAAVWVLAGGSSPMAAYHELLDRDRDPIDWSRVTLLVGDERHVPYDSPDSNWGAISQVLLADHRLAAAHTILPDMDVPVDRSAAELRRGIESLPRTDRGLPRIDLLWLGVGEDGHTLSLFPGHDDALTASDVAIAVHDSPKPPPERITLTLTALAGVGNAVIFATGAAKKEALARALDERQLPIALAAERIVDVGGNVAWLFDPEAASRG